MADILTISGLSKRREGRLVLDGLDLAVKPGERVALLGHNGAGKTTLMKVILGLLPYDTGNVSVAGSAPGKATARAATAYLPESVAFQKSLTGAEQLEFFARLAGEDRKDVLPLLARVGLSDAAHRRIGTYSKGMRQRLGLAQVLLGRPQVALLDEPASGLDPISRRELYAIIDELASQGAAVLIASHALTEVEARTDRIAIMRRGKLVANDTLSGLVAEAGLPTRILLRAHEGKADNLASLLGAKRVNGVSVEISCPAMNKMEHLHRVVAVSGLVQDFSMTPPSLEDLYQYYSGQEEQP